LQFETIGGIALLTNPILIVEVLSPSSQYYDRGAKFTFYQSIPSFREYLLIEQNQPRIVQYVKQDNDIWTPSEISGIESNFVLPSIDCRLDFSDIYQDVTFSN
jgi:Uma2 family endonuclease